MTERDGVQRVVLNAAMATTQNALIRHDAARLGLQPTHNPYDQYNGHHFYGYYDYRYPPEDKVIGIIPWMLRILKYCAIGFVLLCSSVVMYGILYWAAMPGSYASRPLFFDYTGTVVYPHENATATYSKAAISSAAATIQEGQLATSSPSQQTTTYSYTPWASVDLFAIEQAVSWSETISEDLIPPPTIQDRILQPDQAYYVEVHLILPESHWNRQIGMFGVAVDLISHPDANGTSIKLASSVRPARLPYESDWLAVVRKLVWVVPLVFGGMAETMHLTVPSFRHIVETENYPLRHVVTRLVPQTPMARQPGQTSAEVSEQHSLPPVEVVGGEVRIGKELKQWQQVLKDWFYTCYFMGTMVLFGAHVAGWILLQYHWGENLDEYGEPYFDPSCDFSARCDDGFESIQSNENDDRSNDEDPSGAFNHGGHRDDQSNEADFDDASEDWEECVPTDQQGKEEDRTLRAEGMNGVAPSEGLGFRATRGNNRAPSSASRERAINGFAGHSSSRRGGLIHAFAPSRSAQSPRQTNTRARARRRRATMQPGSDSTISGNSQDDNTRMAGSKQRDDEAPIPSVQHEEDCFFDCSESTSLEPVHFKGMSAGGKDKESSEDCLNVMCSGSSSAVGLDSHSSGAMPNNKTISRQDMANAKSCDSVGQKALTNDDTGSIITSRHSWGERNFEGSTRSDSAEKRVPFETKSCSSGISRQLAVLQEPKNPILQVPEAQVLDSFLHDLINPFVR